MKIRITIPKLKTIVITFISIAIVGSLSGAAYFVPEYLKEQQQTHIELKGEEEEVFRAL